MDLRRFTLPLRRSHAARAGALAFSLALTLGVSLGLVLGTAAPRQVVAKAEEDVVKALLVANEAGQALKERSAALRLLARMPAVEEHRGKEGLAFEALREIYPQFESIRFEATLPKPPTEPLVRPEPRQLRLTYPLRSGGYLVGVLRKEWAEEAATATRPFGENGRVATALVSRRGSRTAGVPEPPRWEILSRLQGTDTDFASLIWGDGQSYLTSIRRLPETGETKVGLMVVSGFPAARIEGKVRQVREMALLFGGALGLVAGLVAWVGIARSTRKLRAQNSALEGRVAARTVELEAAERSFRSLFENAPFGLYQCDLEGRLIRVNPTLAHLMGFSSPERMVESLGSLQTIGDLPARIRFLERLRASGEARCVTFAVGDHGRPMWLEETARVVQSADGTAPFIEGALHDVTEQREMEDRLRQIGATDPLTGLLNRRGLEEAMENVEAPVSFVTVDLDAFKRYNDTFGHPAGDLALRTVADAIRRAVRTDDVVARAGGEEFVVVLSRTPTEGARRVAETLRETVAACVGLERPITVSGGVATANALEELDAAYMAADRALYRAKEAGRNRIVVNAAKLA